MGMKVSFGEQTSIGGKKTYPSENECCTCSVTDRKDFACVRFPNELKN